MLVLKLSCLEVCNRRSDRLIPRRFAIDGLSFRVQEGERILIVGGAGAGKNALYTALSQRYRGVYIAPGHELLDPINGCVDSNHWGRRHILLVNGFRTRDQERNDGSGELVDPEAPCHWSIISKATDRGCTVLALAEIDKLDTDKRDRFSRLIVIDEGRLVADDGTARFREHLEQWIDGYAREKQQNLRKNCLTLYRKLSLSPKYTDWLGLGVDSEIR